MEIKAADVAKLRAMTGAGMMDCKKALVEAEGDFDRAQDIIREKGKLVAAKRADRTATQGVVASKIVGQKGYMLCLACETDFVAQNADFVAATNAILDIAVEADAADLDALLAVVKDGKTVAEIVTEKSGQTGEKVELAYYGKIEAPMCVTYIHMNSKLGTLIGFNKEIDKEVAKDVKKKGDAAKVAIRNIRRDAMDNFKKQEKKSEITEDELKQAEKDLQKMTDDYCKKLEDLLAKKEKELMAV